MMKIRPLRENEVEEIRAWWGKEGPLPSMMPLDSTFVLERDAKKAMAISVILTNASVAWLENWVRNPDVPAKQGFKDSQILIEFAEEFARWKGKQIVFCMSAKASTRKRYEKLGYKKTAEVTTMTKGIELCHQ